MKTKLVNVYAPIAIRSINPPIHGRKKNVTMSLSDILKCIYNRAVIDEILPDGSTIRLTSKNYRDDHISQFNTYDTTIDNEDTAVVEDTDNANIHDNVEVIAHDLDSDVINNITESDVVDNDSITGSDTDSMDQEINVIDESANDTEKDIDSVDAEALVEDCDMTTTKTNKSNNNKKKKK